MDFDRSGGDDKLAKKMGRAAVDDSANWLVAEALLALHLPALVVPYAVVKSVAEHVTWRIRRHRPSNYTFWNRPWPELRELYEADWHDAVKLLYRGEWRAVPQQLLADTSGGPLKLDLAMTGPQRFELPHAIGELTWKYRKDLIEHLKANDAYHRAPFSSLAVTGVEFEASRVILEVRPADYDDLLRTHYSLDVDWKGRPSLRQTLLRTTPGTLGTLPGSPLPNILGVDVLIFTPSGSLVLQRRSRHVAVRPGEICASSSGGAKPDDVGKRWPLAALRESREELGLDLSQIAPDSLRFIGLTRDFASHGVIGCYFCADTTETEETIRRRADTAQDRREHTEIILFHFGADLVRGSLEDDAVRGQFYARVDALIAEYGSQCSTPLLAALALWVTDRLRPPGVKKPRTKAAPRLVAAPKL
jgi:8-oxo-dGTP pyrophosphatase MutT (NUDIX family)